MSEHNDWNKNVIEEFRANGGRVGGFFKNAILLLLHTTGAKSGLERVNPVMCLPEGDKIIIIASKAGAPTHPDWYYNLRAHPEVIVELGREKFQAMATITEEPERTKLYNKVAAKYENFLEYEQKTTRVIPVITLTRR